MLARLYPGEHAARRIAVMAGLPETHLSFAGSDIDRWFAILRFAMARDRIPALIEVLLEDSPDDTDLRRICHDLVPEDTAQPPRVPAPAQEELVRAEALLAAATTIVPTHFFERGRRIASSVGLVRAPAAVGTGFLIAGDLLVTCHHVLPTAGVAENAVVVFDYELEADGREREPTTLPLDPARFYRSSPELEDDWAIVAVHGNPCRRYGAIAMNAAVPGPLDYVNIIQHPGGRHKSVALQHNVVVKQTERLIYYLTDTETGSSGAPVFDNDWRLVGVHRGETERPVYRLSRPFRSNVGTRIERLAEYVPPMT